MTLTRSLRWAGNGISNGRQRLLRTPNNARQYSVHLHSGLNRRVARPHCPPTPYPYSNIQSRSISLFGWGSSSKTSGNDTFSSEHAQTPQSTNPGVDSANSSKIIRASHETSESAETLQSQTLRPTDLEPEPLERLQQAIVEPQGDGLATNIATEAERIGYLKEVCGLDFGWGPSSCMEWVLEHLHISAGLSWSAAIMVLAVTLRSFMLPAMLSSAKQQKKMREANPLIAPLRDQYRDAMVTGDRVKAQEYQLQIKHIHKEFDINIMKAFVPMLIQVPFGYGAWRVLRNCGSLPVPGFVTEAWLWTSDLSFSDPYLLCPALSSAIIWYTMKLNIAASGNTANQSFMMLFSNIFPAISFVFMLFQPGAVQLYFLSSTMCGLVTARLMQFQFFRDYFQLGPLPNTPAGRALAAATASATAAATGQTSASSTATPGGLRRRPPPSPTSSSSATATSTTSQAAAVASPEDNRSVIDKGVDAVKDKWSEMKKSANNIQEETLGKMSSREAKAKQERLDKYEAEERARLDEERERRNRSRRGNGST